VEVIWPESVAISNDFCSGICHFDCGIVSPAVKAKDNSQIHKIVPLTYTQYYIALVDVCTFLSISGYVDYVFMLMGLVSRNMVTYDA